VDEGDEMRSSWAVRPAAMVAVICLMALAVTLAAGCGSSSATASASSSSGSVEFIPIDEFSVQDYAGKPLVVNYFGSWCPPCNQEAPGLASWTAGHPDAQFVGIAVDDTEAAVIDFMDKYGLAYPVALDPGWDQANENGVTGVPETVFYDADGKEVVRLIGATTEAQLDLSYAKASQ
jgi:thiol-disulfide isomerase/thioredoxin